MEEKKKPRIGFSLFITNLAESFSKNPPLRTFGDTGGGRGGFVEGVGLGILLLPSSVSSSRKTRPLPIVSIQKDPPAILIKTNVGVGDGDGEEEDCACVMSRFERDFVRKELWGKDFLSRCLLCRKLLHGLDIFMYRGEDAFCSVECREKQIVREDYRENCGSEARRTHEYSVSPRSSPRFLFSVVAAA